MLFRKIRDSRASRIVSFFLALNILAEIISPNVAMALTNGPSQPEFDSFQPVNTTEMVDLFTGDFKYNIPLMDVGGYPLNICYNSGVGMDQEASWVGLGWNLNVGAITRNMRGLPDDFNGQDQVTKEFNMKDNNTFGVHVKLGVELFGWGKKDDGNSIGVTVGLGVKYNNYSGISVEQSAGTSLSAGNGSKGSMNCGMGISSSADEGLTMNQSVSFSVKLEGADKGEGTTPSTTKIGAGAAMGFNSRSGLKDFSLNTSVTKTQGGTSKIVKTPAQYNDDGSLRQAATYRASSNTNSIGSSGTVNFGGSTYIPSINFPMVTNAISTSMKLGVSVFGLDGTLDIGGYYSNQKLSTHNKTLPAYGYMNSQLGQNDENALMDFNREKDGPFMPNMEFLPLTNYSYDVFSVAGQGVGGAFRPFRSDVGHVFDNQANNTSDSYSLGGEFGAAETVHAGIDISVVDVNTTTGKWSSDNDAIKHLKFQDMPASNGNPLYEPYYFKEVGERSVSSDSSFFNDMCGFGPTRVKLGTPSMIAKATDQFEVQDIALTGLIQTKAMPSTAQRSKRDKRNQVMSTLTLDEARNFGFMTSLYGMSGQIPTEAQGHHIAEVTVTKPDGSRYIYGLPAYNKTQIEASFNVSGNTQSGFKDLAYGLISYGGSDNSTGNGKGIDHFYNKVTTPAYAHSYMLTAVVSPDYVDVKSDGPTDDDLGNYTKFTYNKIDNYEWRTPAGSGKVNYNENTKMASPQDDYGSYLYGKKDLFYIDKIETKNYVAFFDTDDRRDGFDITEGGGTGTVTTKLLKAIRLYSKKNSTTGSVPIKTVNFVYDYSLCTYPGINPSIIDDVPNNPGNTSSLPPNQLSNDGGKLTLKQIYFTYGSSDKAKFNKYSFTYDSRSNYPYDPKACDRWGNYKDNPIGSSTVPNDLAALGTVLPNWEFPYVQQNNPNKDLWAAAWSLSTITLPSGGQIDVSYEADDYAYVQNAPAMDMFKVTGVGSGFSDFSPTTNSKNLMDNGAPGAENLYVFFKLDKPLDGTLSATAVQNYMKSHYIKDMYNGRYMYFRFLVNLTRDGGPPDPTKNLGKYFEYVSGYAQLDQTNIVGGLKSAYPGTSSPTTDSNPYDYGYILLKEVDIGKSATTGLKVNPISKAAWQSGRVNFAQLVWDANFSPATTPLDVIKSLANSGIAKNIISAFLGPNLSIALKNYGKEWVPNKSWIRLYDPDGHKVGGGSRVSTLTLTDNWNTMTGSHQANSTYAQKYEYTKEVNGEIISSGVAAYEPGAGNDENPFHLPNYYTNQGNNPLSNTFLVHSDRFFKEEPYGESFFPAATVGYSDVKVSATSLPGYTPEEGPTVSLVHSHGTGYTVHSFYTAKDYPTITKRTNLDKKTFKPPFGGLFKITARDYLTATQGYVVEVNDMHGKPKGIATYPEGKDDPISTIEYYYKTEGSGGYQEPITSDIYNDARLKANKLYNGCEVIRKDGSISKCLIGVDMDMVSDFREQQTTTTSGGAQINLAAFIVGVFPGAVPTIWPDFSYEKSRFRSAVITKVISRYGILEKTIATDLGSRVETRDLAYDAETGEVLLNRTYNEYNDAVYSFTYPAHWMYNQMGLAYQNIDANLKSITFTGGVGLIVSANSYFTVGDEVSLVDVTNPANTKKGWVCSVGGINFTVMNDAGSTSAIGSGTYDVKVIRSGRRNQHSIPIGSVVSLVNPIDNNDDGIYESWIKFDKVTKTGAVEFSDQWQMLRGHDQDPSVGCCELNSFGQGMAILVSNLISGGVFLNTLSTTVYNATSNAYSYGFVPALNTYPNTGLDIKWTCSSAPTGSTAQFQLGPTGKGCHLTAKLPTGTTWPSIIPITALTSYELVQTGCTASGIKFNITYNSGASSTSFTMVSSDCWDFGNCPDNSSNLANCGPVEGAIVNPFVQGLKGNWRTQQSWAYLAPRAQVITTGNTDIRKDGYMTTFNPFWKNTAGVFSKDVSSWTSASQITKYGPLGAELENKDALGRYSAAVYGYNNALPILVASNAQYTQVGFDGFEDYDYQSPISVDCRKAHFNFYEYNTLRTKDESHTGLYSMFVKNGAAISNTRRIAVDPCSLTGSSLCSYALSCGDFLGQFSPANASTTSSQRYLLSYWVKEKLISSPTLSDPPVLDYTSSSVQISLKPPSLAPVPLSILNIKRSPIIDGWQRVECTFDIPASTTGGDIIVSLMNGSPLPAHYSLACDSYFDDVRIQPFTSSMKSFVYDPVTLRYVAELDANNFATFYEYDEEGSLVRVKKETERGIMTLKESKNHSTR